MVIIVFTLAALNFFLYHKIFNVVYFDLGRGLMKELIGCFVAAIAEVALLMTVGQVLLGGIVTIIGFVGSIAVVVVVVVAVIYAVYRVVQYIKKKKKVI